MNEPACPPQGRSHANCANHETTRVAVPAASRLMPTVGTGPRQGRIFLDRDNVGAMPRYLGRRAFLAAAGAARMAAVLRGERQTPSRTADVVVIGGDPAAFAAVYRLTRTADLRVTLIADAPSWSPAPPAAPISLASLPPLVRGHQVCFDTWRDLGNPGWGYADVLPSFKRLERYEIGESAYRGGSGPLSVAHCWDPHAAHRAFLLASASGGFHQDSRHDFNGPRSQGVAGYYQKAILDDRPHTFDAAFLAEALAAVPPRVVRTEAVVLRIVIEGGRAVGVEIGRGPRREVIRAERGVLLCAPPVRAAQLLMLSGIGSADHLRAAGIAVAADRAGVGGNLHDHVRLPLRWQALPPALDLPASSVTAGMFTVSLNASPPDLQMDFVDPRAANAPEVGIDITLVQPASRGEVRLQTSRPMDAPAVSLRPLTDDKDVAALVQGVRLARLVAGSPQLDRLRGDETVTSGTAQTAAALQAFARASAVPRGHHAGTCAMGPEGDRRAVVDATLAVHGVRGLHVAGASIMPVVVNGPPASASLMIGDRAADFVLGG